MEASEVDTKFLADVLSHLGIRTVAREFGLAPGTVHYWQTQGLPRHTFNQRQRSRTYERRLARMIGMPTGEFRRRYHKKSA